MDRLVISDVKEVEMVFRRRQNCSTTFRLTNLMHTMHVAISLSTTNPSLFTFTHPFSIIPPLSTSSFTLNFISNSNHHLRPPLSSHQSLITVRSSMLPTGKAHQDDLRRLFSKPGPHVFKDATIPISFVGPHVAEYLLSSSSVIPLRSSEIASQFHKAISGCSVSQLTCLLRTAVENGKGEFVPGLIDAGGDVNCRDSTQESIVSLTVRSGEIEVLRDLIACGCGIDDSIDKVFHEAARMNRVDLMEVLWAGFKNIDPNSGDPDGRNPLHICATHGHVECLKFLISIGGDPDGVDSNGWTPLHFAASEGNAEAVEFLLNSCLYAKYAITKKGETAFTLAMEKGHAQLFDSLYLGDVLNKAVRADDTNGINSCLSSGANIDGKDQNGWTPLHRAAFKGKLESVETLLNHGAQVNVVDDAGYSPLHCAIETGHLQIALLLIGHGAKANLKSFKDSVPFDLDCFKKHSSFVSSIMLEEKVSLSEKAKIKS